MKYIKYFPVLFWMALIFFLSSRPDLPKAEIYFWEFLFKKSGHLFVYFVLTFIWLFTLTKNKIADALIFSYAYAYTDEIHQLFVPGRTGLLRDVYIDLLGIILAIAIFVFLHPWNKKPTSLTQIRKPKI